MTARHNKETRLWVGGKELDVQHPKAAAAELGLLELAIRLGVCVVEVPALGGHPQALLGSEPHVLQPPRGGAVVGHPVGVACEGGAECKGDGGGREGMVRAAGRLWAMHQGCPSRGGGGQGRRGEAGGGCQRALVCAGEEPGAAAATSITRAPR